MASVNFDDKFLSVLNKKEENKMKKENIKEQIAPEVKNSRAFWYAVMAPAIAAAKKAAKAADVDAAKEDANFGITVSVANRFSIEDAKKAKTAFAVAFEEAKAKVEAKA